MEYYKLSNDIFRLATSHFQLHYFTILLCKFTPSLLKCYSLIKQVEIYHRFILFLHLHFVV
jgi:hypothetical protein